jgi:hypothetical protein
MSGIFSYCAMGWSQFCKSKIDARPLAAQGIEAEILADFAKQNPLDWSG